ncbi:MAG TPA: LytTR family DNA-binding domain-containing protein [Usitatibacter sp.]|jgi:DNA-binding LytR/AlgR family response regulator|nr:LytTR family DNA-binding domain-containing protein [Usitatibacter sp.]
MKAVALIADDEPNLAEHLRGRLQALWPELDILPLAPNGLDALRSAEEDAPDVAFLDIRMPGLTGLDLARRLDPRTHVVFVTAYDEYALEAFEREAVDYLVKPVAEDRLVRCVERLQRRLQAAAQPAGMTEVLERIARALPASSGGGRLRWVRALKGDVVQQIPVDEVLYFQAQDKYTCVITPAGEHLIRTPLAEVAAQLDPEVFWQVHRGTIVNMDEVASTRRDLGGRVFVRLKDGKTELAVSRAYAQRFKHM